jgi:hypothetical protein
LAVAALAGLVGACLPTDPQAFVAGPLFAAPEPAHGAETLSGRQLEGFDAAGRSLGVGSELVNDPGWYVQGGMQPGEEVLLRFSMEGAVGTAVLGMLPAVVLWVDEGVFHEWPSQRVDRWLRNAASRCARSGQPRACRAPLAEAQPDRLLAALQIDGLALLLVRSERNARLDGEPPLVFVAEDEPAPVPVEEGTGLLLFGPRPAGPATLEWDDGSHRVLHLLPATVTSLWSLPEA